jgi:hypothetical protein
VHVLHRVQQRRARWLLMTHDRMHEQDFRLSHEFMAVMLGVTSRTGYRPNATYVATSVFSSRILEARHDD